MNTFALLSSMALLLSLLLTDSLSEDITCRVIWMFKDPCTIPNHALVHQVKSWNSKKCSDDQERCMYEIIKSSDSNLDVRHTSKSTRKVTKMSFSFTPPAAEQFCKIRAFSVTTPKNGTGPNDFCLFHNLFEASGLIKDPGYKEISNEKMCPSRKTAKCMSKESQLPITWRSVLIIFQTLCYIPLYFTVKLL